MTYTLIQSSTAIDKRIDNLDIVIVIVSFDFSSSTNML